MVGSSVGPYRVLRKLGSGGMGEVFLAEDTRLARKVALKTLSKSWTEAPDARQRLLREARAAARLNHPNIAGIYDVLESGHIVMEYVEGETLAALLERGPLPADRAVEIALQLADALEQAHAHGVIHRDLKPANVHITAGGKVKVLDFGLAKTTIVSDAAGEASTGALESFTSAAGQLVGTPAYMAPEQIVERTACPASDIYALGVILFEMLSGRRPYQGANLMALAMAVVTSEPPSLIELDPRIPAELAGIVARAMAKQPGARFASAGEMRDALAALGAGAGAVSGPSVLDAAAEAPLRKSSRLRWGALVLAPLLALAAVVGSRFLGDRAPPASHDVPIVAVLPFQNVSGDPGNDYLGTGIADVLIANLGSVAGITVVSRMATLGQREKAADIRSFTRNLGASFVVDGGVQRAGDRVRVTASLSRADSQANSWSRAFDGHMSNIFELERELTEGLIEALQVTLGAAERRRVGASVTTSADAFDQYAQGRARLLRLDLAGNLDRAEEHFKRAVKIDPRFALAHSALGELYFERFKLSKEPNWTTLARDETMEALRLDPEQPHVRKILARIYHGTGRREEAIEELKRSLRLQPHDDEAHRELGEIFAELGRSEEAIAELRRAVDVRPFWQNYRALGRECYTLGRYQEAIAAFERIIEMQPDSSWGFQMLGTTYHAMGDLGRAVENYERANTISPTGSAWSGIGTIHYDHGRYAEAADAYREAIKLGSTNPIYHRNLGDTYRKLGREQEARKAYERVVALSRELLKVNPKDARTLSRMAICEAKLGRRAEADRHVGEAIALVPADNDVVYRKAVVAALAGRESEAIAALRAALNLGFSAARAQQDDDLASLRSLSEFRTLIRSKP